MYANSSILYHMLWVEKEDSEGLLVNPCFYTMELGVISAFVHLKK